MKQADLSPEILDLSLDIDEASLGEKTEIRGDQTVPVASNGSHELAKCGPAVPGSPPEKKLSSRPRCSMCGKPLFSALGKAADATCARCKKEQVGREDGSVVSRSSWTAEEIWRLRLQPEKGHENGLAAPTNPTPQPHHEPSLGKQPPEKPTAEIGRQPERAGRSPSSQSETEAEHGGGETAGESDGRMEKMTSAATVEEEGDVVVTHGEEVAETRWLTASRGPSVEANELERRPGSPVNKNTNNDDAAGMESDNALSDTRLSRSSAGSGVRPNVGRKVANAAGPPVKLPGSFSWPDLIGFALAEARDHRMTAAQVHQWIADNVDNYSVHNTTQRSSIAATLSQQKVKFPKTEPITEGSRQLCRWMLAPDWVPNFRQGLDDVRESLSKTSSQPGLSQRRKELNDAPKPARGAPSMSAAKPAPPQKESSKTSMHTEDPPMFIKRHRVAYDADGRDIVAGFKEIPIEKWTQLAEVESFRKHGLRLFVGDYIKAPLPNRFRFADYTHKPLVQTIAQIEEIRQRRDGPGYAVLVQWFLTKEAAEWWKCRLVKSLWPKDEKAGVYVPATIWDILTSEFVAEQEKLDAEEAKRQIVPNLFFDLDTDKLRLYLKEGRGPKMGIAFGPRASDESNGAEDTACGLNRPEERFSGLSRHIEHLPKRPKVPDETSEASEQPSPPKPLSPSHHVSPRKTGPSALAEEQPTESSPRTSPVQTEQDSAEQDSAEQDSAEQDLAEQDLAETLDLERQLFTPSPAHGPAVEAADMPGPASATLSAPTPTTERPAKRQKTGVTPEEQEAIRAFIRKEQENAKYESKSLWAAAPDYDPANELWDREAKIAEIKARPSRKARFGQNLAYARWDRSPNALYIEVERPLPKTYKAPPSNRPGSGYSNSNRGGGGGGKAASRADSARSNLDAADYYMRRPNPSEQQANDDNTDMADAPHATQASSTEETGREGWEGWTTTTTPTPSNDEADMMMMMEERPETFETLEELLGLPTNFVPTIYEGRLAFRDGTVGLDGRRPRAKKIFKVGRNVPGELK
ncbi:hypothetical protein SLS58_007673 [Diplodia intermedia]|uniref:Fork-head domain-containing protein n=1 Tax=Diplodia intermedia TaxID=856260 RepID=A0ABR3TJB3_9PEZI